MTEFNLRFIAEAANTLRFGSTIFYQTISSLQGWNKLLTDSLQCKECALFYSWGAWRNCVDDLVCEDGMSIKFHCSRNSFIRSKNSAQLYNENHKPYARRHIPISSPLSNWFRIRGGNLQFEINPYQLSKTLQSNRFFFFFCDLNQRWK